MSNQMENKQKYNVTITRVFDAPREIVFRAWTDERLMKQWWGPQFFTNPVCQVDARPGGKFLIHMQDAQGNIYPDSGEFLEVVPPERLVFLSKAFEDETGAAALEVHFTVTFAEEGSQTRMTLVGNVLRATPEMEGPLSGMEMGWTQSFDKLDEVFSPTSRSSLTVHEEYRVVALSRVFDAPREVVYQVYTDPKLVPQWWGPRGLTTTVDRMDVRPGGTWRYVQRDENGEYAFNGEYREVTPPERLVYTFEYEGMPGHIILETVLFEDLGERTRVTAIDNFESLEDLRGMVESGMEQGATESYDRFAELLQVIQRETH